MKDKFKELESQIRTCKDCKEHFGYEPHPIMWGNLQACIMQISQAPSLQVHTTGIPFHDASGKKLRSWYAIDDETFYDKDNFYITSLAHCYPGKSKSGGDRLPPKCCAPKWLYQEMQIVDAKMYIVIGSYAAKLLFPNQSFEELIFHDQVLQGKRAFVLPHPSPLNRRWFKQHPSFESQRIIEIRKVIYEVLEL